MVSPEFGVFHHPGFTEYRVENWRLARDGSGRVVSGVSGWTWQYSLLPLLAALVWPRVHDSIALLSGLILILVYLIYFKCTQDFVIHEGLRGWNVRYFLAAVRLSGSGDFQLHVAYENILPHFAILREVYRGVQAVLPNGR